MVRGRRHVDSCNAGVYSSPRWPGRGTAFGLTVAESLLGPARSGALSPGLRGGDVLGPLDPPVPIAVFTSTEAAFVSLPMPAVVRGVDTGGWITWCLAGLSVFTHDQPPVMRRVYTEAKRIAMSLAMLRSSGNITVAAQALGTSRRALRDGLRAVGLYPWPGVDGNGPRSDEVALSPAGEVSIGKDGRAIEACARSSDSDRA